jgi:heme exporter protein D
MSWEAVGTFLLVLVTLVGINVGTIKSMLDRHRNQTMREAERWQEIERGLFELRASLPLEYVRREDWIRFSGTLDAKLDALREEMREEIGDVKERLYVGRN